MKEKTWKKRIIQYFNFNDDIRGLIISSFILKFLMLIGLMTKWSNDTTITIQLTIDTLLFLVFLGTVKERNKCLVWNDYLR